jgi:hypothetical protein
MPNRKRGRLTQREKDSIFADQERASSFFKRPAISDSEKSSLKLTPEDERSRVDSSNSSSSH